MQIRCKWGRRDEFIKNNFLAVLPVFQIGINHLAGYFCWGGVRTLSFFFLFFLSSLPTVGPLEHLAPATHPRGRGGWTLLRRAHQTFLVFHSGDRWPWRTFARGKTALPKAGARNPRKGRAGSSFSGWPRAPSRVPGSPLSLFPRGRAQVPPQSASGFPLPEKNPKTHGVLAGYARLVSARKESWPCFMKTSGIELEVIDLGIITHVVLRKG